MTETVRIVLVVLLAFAASMLPRAPAAAPATAPTSEAPLAPFRARYEVWRNGKLAGEARFALLTLADGRREWTTRMRGTRGLAAIANLEIDERSVFLWRNGAPELIESSYDQRAAFTSRKRSLRVDQPSNTIASFDGKRLHTLAFAAYTIDVHLTTVALMARLSRDAGASLELIVATRDEIERHRYERVGEETVAVPAGAFRTLRVRRARENRERSSESWLAPSLGYLPVRIDYEDSKGERIELRLVARSGALR
ncbi:MAG TPA: DUF3108 domain-containing protein [Candidatus Saccharimonadia bacterium]|nr:DUF3108 domain-containing protein [Candidatus Saccharimonadia bacterium]